jgi:hypothetical protein
VALSPGHDAHGWFSVPEALQLPLATSGQEQTEAFTDVAEER